MKTNLMLSTAVLALSLGTAVATAQTPNTGETAHDRNGNPVRSIEIKRAGDNTAQTPAAPATSSSSTTNASSTPAATTTQNSQTPSTASQPATPTSQPATAQSSPPSPSSQPGSAQSATTPSSTTPSSANNATTTNQPAAAQGTTPVTQQPSTASTTAPAPPTAQQTAPAAGQATTANKQSPVQLSASLQVEQKTKLSQAFTSVELKPLNNVSFSVTVGSTIPRTVDFRPLPSSVVAIIPQYRGYNYVLVRDEIVIIEPGTSRIVDVIERSGRTQARSTTTSERSVKLSKQQRDYIREKSVRRTTTTTTGSAPRSATRRVMVGDRIPDTVELETLPEEIYREVPTVRSYRYMRGERGIYLVDPQRRTIIEDLDD